MKRKKLKSWVVWFLSMLSVVSLIIMGGDSESMKVFIISKIITVAVFSICSYILLKYEVIYEK